MKKLLVALVAFVALTSVAHADPHWGRGGWHGGWGGGWHVGGNAAAGGFIGGLAGSILGNILSPPPPPVVVAPAPIIVAPQAVPEIQPWTGPWYAYCANKYRTFDAHTGSYMGFDGQPHFCGS